MPRKDRKIVNPLPIWKTDPSWHSATLEAVAKTGGPYVLGPRLGIAPQAVSQWIRVPAHHVRAVAKLSGIPMSKLRPDLYDPDFAPLPEPWPVVRPISKVLPKVK